MEISGTDKLPTLRLNLSRQQVQGLSLRAGQSLNATVISTEPSGKLSLDVGGKLLQATTSLRLLAGMQLQLQVEKSATQTLLTLSRDSQELLLRQHALREALPKQAPLKPLLEQLVRQRTTGEVTATSKTSQGIKHGETTNVSRSTPVADTIATMAQTRLGQFVKQQANVDAISRSSQGINHGERNYAPRSAPLATSKPAAAVMHLEQSIARLIAVLPTITRLGTAEGLQQAIAASGLFMERSLLRQPPTQAHQVDVKTALLRLADSIRQNLAQGTTAKRSPGSSSTSEGMGREGLQVLLRQVESGLARIQLQQLSNLSQQPQGEERQQLTVELPLLHPQQRELETLRLTIRREGQRRRSGASSDWSVTLHLEPAGFGAIHAVVALASGKVSTTFWCEQSETSELFRHSLTTLQERFKEQGLEVGRCTALVGTPPPELADEDPAVSLHGLVDTTA